MLRPQHQARLDRQRRRDARQPDSYFHHGERKRIAKSRLDTGDRGGSLGAMIRGLWADWLRYGQGFDLITVGSQCIAELFSSLRAKCATPGDSKINPLAS